VAQKVFFPALEKLV